MLVFPVLFGNVLGTWGKDVAKFLPVQAGSAFATSMPESPHLSPWAGCSCCWPGSRPASSPPWSRCAAATPELARTVAALAS